MKCYKSDRTTTIGTWISNILDELINSLCSADGFHFQSSMSSSHKTSSLDFAALQKSISIPKASMTLSFLSSTNSKEIQAQIPGIKGCAGEKPR